jgi:hypothetical protein
VSAYLSELARTVTRSSGSDWLPGSMAAIVLGTVLVSLIFREISRGALTEVQEQRARATAALVVPLVLCATVAFTVRFLELGA